MKNNETASVKDVFSCALRDGMSFRTVGVRENDGISEYTLHFEWREGNARANDAFEVSWQTPQLGLLYEWTPASGLKRNIAPEWSGSFKSMISAHAPVCVFYDGQGVNRYSWALSECQKLVYVKNGIVEENGNVRFSFSLPTSQFASLETELIVRVDRRRIGYGEAIAAVARWWETDCGMKSAYVPEAARCPAYSFWYSYHQNVTDKEVEDECRRAKEMGFEVCIIDDGWQTEDTSRGYAFCGDWEPATSKFPDMRAHVARVHEIGMKYVLWFSVSFLGYRSKHYERFKDMVLRKAKDEHGAAIFDPRYREVREFLLDVYKKALTEWDLDGFKLDFIDEWREKPENAAPNARMDIPSLQEAVDVFMTTVLRELKSIKPDVLIEFRQSYIGPHMKTFGNMFRVADCPGDYISNRVGVIDLRMLMGKQAVHSDMLTWHPDERPEYDAMQIIGVMFGVMQYSARLDRLSPEVRRMSDFWLGFLTEHKNTLLGGELTAYDPQDLYSWAQAVGERETIAAVYQAKKIVSPTVNDTVWIANGAECDSVVTDICGKFDVTAYDCTGRVVSSGETLISGISSIPVPVGGIVRLCRASL